jgi:hypothetical protein
MWIMLAVETRGQIEQRALEIAADIEKREGKFAAEIVAGCIPQWHIIVTLPGREGTAADHLAERGFGVYVPQLDKKNAKTGAVRSEKMFPSYSFIFVWDVEAHWDRIKACTGVSRILMRGPGLPAAIAPDDLIQEIQGYEFQSFVRARIKVTRASKRGRIRGAGSNYVMTVTCKSYLFGFNEDLAPAERIRLLHRALGLS